VKRKPQSRQEHKVFIYYYLKFQVAIPANKQQCRLAAGSSAIFKGDL
jgi:hypothetical protein